VTCGHTHAAFESFVDGVRYINSGTWTEHPPCPFVSISGGRVGLEYWPKNQPRSLPAQEEGLASASASTAEAGRD
jgi:hypothetical protein